jgi:ABC-type dipeptide/oligopeptide/nickel transport system ATPase component
VDLNKAEEFLNLYSNDLKSAIQALETVYLLKNPEKKRKQKTGPTVVELVDITKKYKIGNQHIEALKGVSLTIGQGEFVAITGSSGSGKSTLLQIIGGLDKPTSGKIIVDEKDISRLSDRQLSDFRNKTIGFVFQFFYLQPFLDLKTNIQVPAMFTRKKLSETNERAVALAGEVGLSDRIKHLPKELSGGQMQRGAIARALINNPKVLLADEPTGNLDSANGKVIIELFEKIRKRFNTTIIIVTHDSKVAAMADREITLADGALKQ